MILPHKRDLLLVGGGRLAAALLSLITIRAVTTFLSPVQYGMLALLVAVQMFCGLFLVNPIGQHINLHTHAWWDDGSLMVRLKHYRLYVFAVSIIGGAVVFCMVKQQTMELYLWTSAVMFAAVVAGTWNATLIPILNMLGFRAASVLWSIITVTTGLLCAILFVKWWPYATAWFAGQIVGMGIGALGAKYVLRRHALDINTSQGAWPLIDRGTIISYCLPLALATGLMWLQLSGYRFLIESYWGLAQLGFMAVGLQLAGQISGLAESLAMQFLNPLFFRRVSAHEEHDEVLLAFSDLLNTLVPVYFVLTGLIILSAPYLLKLLVAAQYQDAIIFVMLGAGIELFRMLGNLLSNAAHIRRKTNSLALPYAVGAVTSLTLILIAGLWQKEVVWVGTALVSGAVVMFFIMFISMYRQVKFQLDVARCFIGFATMFVMIVLVAWAPAAEGVQAAIGYLSVVFAFSSLVILALMLRNPAILRLLNVQLRKS